MESFLYQKEKTREISFPLGGIGTGCVGLSGNGQLIDIEIFNRANKGSHGGMSHFAVKVEDGNKLLDARVICGDTSTPYTGKYHRPHFNSYGFGADRSSLAGLPHFEICDFKGEFPIAELEFKEKRFPGTMSMTAFNPFIPANEDDSSIPGAFFELQAVNTTDKQLTYSMAFTMSNLYTRKGGTNRLYEEGPIHLIHMTNKDHDHGDAEYGDLCIATDAEDVSLQQYWYRGIWFDNLVTFWNDFCRPGKLNNRVYHGKKDGADETYAAEDLAVLAAHCVLNPGESKKIRFVLTWNTPNFYNYWTETEAEKKKTWKNYYAKLFRDSKDSAFYALREWDRLYEATRLFKDTLFSTTIPKEALDAVSANISIIKSPTCIRLEDGSLYGFEGNHIDGGCCEGSCTHVWNYTYAIPFLFPRLERSMRKLEYQHSMREDGSMGFRLMLPVGSKPWEFRACVDGQMGTVMRVYREYKICGDKEWLASIWPEVKRSIAFAWSEENKDCWDRNKDGVMEGRQHHTLDMELYGENSWLTGLYLGALRAGGEIARILGEEETALEYDGIFEKGREILNRELFNGEYFFQKVDVKDKGILETYKEGGLTIRTQDIFDTYWNKEQEEIMYQIGEGCAIDQVIAQWHANLMGLGEIFVKEKVKKSLTSIFKYNYVYAREHFNPCRFFSMNDEHGLVICQWPEGRKKPFIPIPYAEETMYGFEYQAAIHMIQEGLEEQGMECIRAIRERFDGEKRNPWNEYECGSNYARSMASYALLLTYSGFEYDAGIGLIGFHPIHRENFRSFWSLDSGWGRVSFEQKKIQIDILYGSLKTNIIKLGTEGEIPEKVIADGKNVEFEGKDGSIFLSQPYKAVKSIEVCYS